MKQIVDRETAYDYEAYTIVVGSLQPDQPEVYMVQNKETKVVEFTHEVLPFVMEWILHFEKRLKDIKAGKAPDEDAHINSIVQSMN